MLVAGGGVAAIEAVLGLHALAGERVAIELLAPGGDFVERPSSVLFPFSGQAAPRVSLDRLAELGVTVHRGALGAVDVDAHEVRTTDGGRLGYDRLIVATGARPVDGVPGATTFSGPRSAGAVEHALRDARERVLFTLPAGAGWTLPLYELALLAARELPDGPELTIVTAEPRPLDIFGPVASDALARLLDRAGIGFEGETVAEAVVGGALATRDGRLLAADAVIALARLAGPDIDGPARGRPRVHRGRRARPRHRRRGRVRRRRRHRRADQAGRPRDPAGRRRRRGDRRRGRRPGHAASLPARAARRRPHRRGAAVPAPRPRRRPPARPRAARRARRHLTQPALVALRARSPAAT